MIVHDDFVDADDDDDDADDDGKRKTFLYNFHR